MIRDLLAILCTLILLLQVSNIRPNFFINLHSYNYGITAEQASEATAEKYQVRPAVTFSSKPADVHDSIIFTGDVLLARNVEVLMERYGMSYPFLKLPFTTYANKPFVFGNFESALPVVHQPTNTGGMTFSVNAEYLPALTTAGFTHLSLANNHSFDFKSEGYENAYTKLESIGLTPFGIPQKLTEKSVTFVTVEETTVAVIALEALAWRPTAETIHNVMLYAKTHSDIQILYVHWGDEYVAVNNSVQRTLAQQFITDGVDLIVGHHPHVVQNIDSIDGVPVVYSLGNFIFDQYDDTATQTGLLVQLDVSSAPTVTLLPVSSIGTLSQPHEMSQTDHARFLKALAANSSPELKKFIVNGSIPLQHTVATSSKIAMISK